MPKKHLSQNFLYDPSILSRIIQAANVTANDTVVEIGPGPGRLTRLLCERARRVVAIELDHELYANLKDELAHFTNLELHHRDALKFDFSSIGEQFKVVANIPYHITSPIIFKLLEYLPALQSMTLTVQKEVAQRVAAPHGGKDYGVLSLMVQYHGQTEVKFIIPRGAFRPVPRVDSACLHVALSSGPRVEVADQALFIATIKTAFQHRRKTMHNALKALEPAPDEALRASGIDPMRRPETLSMQDFARLADNLLKLKETSAQLLR